MKKVIFTFLSLLVGAFTLFAQDTEPAGPPYVPMDTWPYLYPTFETGAVRTSKGALLNYNSLNISITDGKLHYIEKGKIMQADMKNVYTALIGEDDVYVCLGGKMYKVLVETEDGHILSYTSVDMDELNKVDIGYGVSSSTASRTNTSLAGLGLSTLDGVNMVDMTLNRAEQQKNTGKELPVKVETFFFVNGKIIPANKRDVQDLVGKDASKAFFKANKLKWNKPETLVPVLAFLRENIQ